MKFLMDYYQENRDFIHRLYKSSVAVWIWTGDESLEREIPPISVMYRIIDPWDNLPDGERHCRDLLVIPFIGVEHNIFWGLPILEFVDGEIVPSEGRDLIMDHYFCNECQRDFVAGWLCEVCDYDLCQGCSSKKINHHHTMFDFSRYYGIMTYQKDNIVETYVLQIE